MMSTLVLTLALAATLVVLCLGLLGIGYLITGKSKLRAGACDSYPEKKKNEDKK
jgi:hypothetical protein